MRTLLALVLSTLAVSAVAATHPFGVHDMVAMDRVSDPQVSPDGRWIAYVIRSTDLDANRGRTDLWLVGTDGTGLKRLTSNPANDTNPRWSPDGKWIYFLSTRSGSSQVWRISFNGGEGEQVTHLPLEVSNMILSPDGSELAFSLEVFPGTSADETAARLDADGKRKSSGKLFTGLFIRHWDTWSNGTRNHVFVTSSDGSGKTVDIMRSMDADCPSKPFGGSEEFTFTPDNRSIIFTARNVGASEPWSTNFDLYSVAADGSGAPKDLTAENKAWDTTPTFSPDGKTLAYMAMSRPGFESDRFRIVVRSWPDGSPRVLTEKWDRSPSIINWSSDGKSIYAVADNLGQTSLFAIDAAGGTARTVVRNGTVDAPHAARTAAGDRVIYCWDSLLNPADLYSVSLDGRDQKRLTDTNHDRMAAVRTGEPSELTFKGANDDMVHGWVIKPVDFDPSKKYPVAFLIHGGPQGSWTDHFHYRWNAEAFAGAGYGVVEIDFHGSTGYGQAFLDAIRGDWGGKPLVDLQRGLAAAIAGNSWMDGNRVAALGASYGAYMINWIAGNWSDRFKCLVSHDGNLDERFAYFATEELWFPEWEHQGTPWTNAAGYEKQNPINFVQNWKTPMMIVHSANDFRITDSEGFASFTALQRLGVPSQLLYFPDESHFVLKPANSIEWYDSVIAWIDRWTK